MDGWNEEVRDLLEDSFSNLESLMYEVRNCVRGGYTGCKTNAELAEYLTELGDELRNIAYDVQDAEEQCEEED